MKLESVWRTRLKEWVKGRWGDGAYMQMAHGNEVSAGLPDIQVLVMGQLVWLELKAVKNTSLRTPYSLHDQPTKLQTHTMHQVHKAGGLARVLVFHNDLGVVMAYPIIEVVERRARGNVGVLREELQARGMSVESIQGSEVGLRRMLFGV